MVRLPRRSYQIAFMLLSISKRKYKDSILHDLRWGYRKKYNSYGKLVPEHEKMERTDHWFRISTISIIVEAVLNITRRGGWPEIG